MEFKLDPEYVLGALMDLRDYQKLEERVSRYLNDVDWSTIIKVLDRGKKLRKVAQTQYDNYIPIREGILRDGMMALLHLEDFNGLDSDFLESFSDLEGGTLEKIRLAARERALELLDAQIKNRNTYFLDIEEMVKRDLARFIPEIVETRISEYERLDPEGQLDEICSSYYGFKIITAGGMSSDIPQELGTNLKAMLDNIGLYNDFDERYFPSLQGAFSNCSWHMKQLLWSLVDFCFAKKEYKMKALKKLGALGDSRALEFLYHGFELNEELLDQHELKLCIGRIGHPDSYEIMKNHSIIETWVDLNDLFAIAGIRHPDVLEIVDDFVKRSETMKAALIPKYQGDTESMIETFRGMTIYETTIEKLIQVMGRTRRREYLEFYEKYREKYVHGLARTTTLARVNIHPEFDCAVRWT